MHPGRRAGRGRCGPVRMSGHGAHLHGALHAGLLDLGLRPHVQQHPPLLHELRGVLRRHIAHRPLGHLHAGQRLHSSEGDKAAASSSADADPDESSTTIRHLCCLQLTNHSHACSASRQHCEGDRAAVGRPVVPQGRCKLVLTAAHLILPPLLCSCIVSTARACSCRHNLLAPHSTCSRTSC